ncbi:hypothetical protein [Actinoplanes sp. DH11]|uniref:hypothetical protein n=1 Tax=Actinoplanes sp. DH11 TaxID=2857011 RepID=UPI001E462FC1|nr:hypothetical protein [Actinoplanes sp. DH11]
MGEDQSLGDPIRLGRLLHRRALGEPLTAEQQETLRRGSAGAVAVAARRYAVVEFEGYAVARLLLGERPVSTLLRDRLADDHRAAEQRFRSELSSGAALTAASGAASGVAFGAASDPAFGAASGVALGAAFGAAGGAADVPDAFEVFVMRHAAGKRFDDVLRDVLRARALRRDALDRPARDHYAWLAAHRQVTPAGQLPEHLRAWLELSPVAFVERALADLGRTPRTGPPIHDAVAERWAATNGAVTKRLHAARDATTAQIRTIPQARRTVKHSVKLTAAARACAGAAALDEWATLVTEELRVRAAEVHRSPAVRRLRADCFAAVATELARTDPDLAAAVTQACADHRQHCDPHAPTRTGCIREVASTVRAARARAAASTVRAAHAAASTVRAAREAASTVRAARADVDADQAGRGRRPGGAQGERA